MASFGAATVDQQAIFYTHERMKLLLPVEIRHSYLFYLIDKYGRRIKSKAREIQFPYLVNMDATVKWMTPSDTLPTGESMNAAMGYVNHRFIAAPMSKNILEEMLDDGNPEVFINKWELVATRAAWAMARGISQGIWTGSGAPSPDGISTMIEKAAPASQTASPMGMSKATYTFMRNGYVQLTAPAGGIAAGSSQFEIEIAMKTLIERATYGLNRPSHVILNRAAFNIFKRVFAERQASSSYLDFGAKDELDFGFETFVFDKVTFGWDVLCPADSAYALHIKSNKTAKWNDGDDPTEFDYELESVPELVSKLDWDDRLVLLHHPNVNMRKVSARSAGHTFDQTEWVITSCNLAIPQPSRQAVLGSDTGSRLEVWV